MAQIQPLTHIITNGARYQWCAAATIVLEWPCVTFWKGSCWRMECVWPSYALCWGEILWCNPWRLDCMTLWCDLLTLLWMTLAGLMWYDLSRPWGSYVYNLEVLFGYEWPRWPCPCAMCDIHSTLDQHVTSWSVDIMGLWLLEMEG